jgi:hypothetical protein
MGIKQILWEGVDWIQMIQDRIQWQTPVNTVINLSENVFIWCGTLLSTAAVISQFHVFMVNI